MKQLNKSQRNKKRCYNVLKSYNVFCNVLKRYNVLIHFQTSEIPVFDQDFTEQNVIKTLYKR